MVFVLDSRSFFSFSNYDWGKYFAIFRIDNSSSVHIYNKKKFKLVLGESPTHSLDDGTITSEAKASINFWRSQKKIVKGFCLLMPQKYINLNNAKSEIKLYYEEQENAYLQKKQNFHATHL